MRALVSAPKIKALVSATQLRARSLRLSASAAQILIGERWAQISTHFCAQNWFISQFLGRKVCLNHKNLNLFSALNIIFLIGQILSLKGCLQVKNYYIIVNLKLSRILKWAQNCGWAQALAKSMSALKLWQKCCHFLLVLKIWLFYRGKPPSKITMTVSTKVFLTYPKYFNSVGLVVANIFVYISNMTLLGVQNVNERVRGAQETSHS